MPCSTEPSEATYSTPSVTAIWKARLRRCSKGSLSTSGVRGGKKRIGQVFTTSPHIVPLA